MSEVINMANRLPVHVAPEPDADVVAVLEDLLRQAKAGDVIGIAYATTRIGGDISTGWATSAGLFPLLAALTVLNARAAKEVS
jgi:hypothetical protein